DRRDACPPLDPCNRHNRRVPVASFLPALIAIFVAAKLFGEIAERIGQPAVLGELIGGVVIGVSGLRLVDPSNDTIHLLAQLGDREAQVILGAAVIDDIIGVILLTFMGGSGGSAGAISRTAAIAFGFVFLALVIGSLLAPHLIRAIERIQLARGLFFVSLIF